MAANLFGSTVAHEVLQDSTIYKQRNQLQSFWDKQKKKYIVLDLNEQFTSIKIIKRAQDKSTQNMVKGQCKPHTNRAQTSSREPPTPCIGVYAIYMGSDSGGVADFLGGGQNRGVAE